MLELEKARNKVNALSPWAWQRSYEIKVRESEKEAVVSGALDIGYAEFDVWREIQVQMSNTLVWLWEANLGLVGKT